MVPIMQQARAVLDGMQEAKVQMAIAFFDKIVKTTFITVELSEKQRYGTIYSFLTNPEIGGMSGEDTEYWLDQYKITPGA